MSIPVTGAVDWDKLIRALEATRIRVPRYEPGEPPPLGEYQRLMGVTIEKRQRLDSFLAKLTRRCAESKRRIDLLKEYIRQERNLCARDPAFAEFTRRADRDAAIEHYLNQRTSQLAIEESRRSDLIAARDLVTTHIETLKATKEALNGMLRAALGEVDMRSI